MEKSKGIQLDVLLLIKEKRRLRRVWMKSRNPLDKTALNKASKKLKEKLCENKNKAVQQYLENLSANKQDDYTLWKATKYFRRMPKVNQPIRNEEGHWAKNNKGKAKLFVNHLKKVFTPNDTVLPNIQKIINNSLEEPFQMTLPIRSITSQEVRKAIKGMPLKKAPGYDLINAGILQHVPKKVIAFITTLYNATLRL